LFEVNAVVGFGSEVSEHNSVYTQGRRHGFEGEDTILRAPRFAYLGDMKQNTAHVSLLLHNFIPPSKHGGMVFINNKNYWLQKQQY